MRANPATGGFSLVEVATSIGVIAFALVALLGVFPLGLENSRLTVGDTRATQLMKTVAATLQGEPFAAAECFSPKDGGLTALDLTAFGPEKELSSEPDVLLYASYDVTALPQLIRATKEGVPADAIYRIDLRFQRQRFVPAGATAALPGSRVVGTNVNLRIYGAREDREKRKPFAESWIYVPNITRP